MVVSFVLFTYVIISHGLSPAFSALLHATMLSGSSSIYAP